MKRVILTISLVALVVSIVLAGCGAPEPAPTPTPAPAPAPAPKEPVVLRAVAFMPDFTKAVKALGWYAEAVNERANGELIIEWVGGPEVIGPFEQAAAVASGAIDIAAVPGAFYRSQVPEAYTLPFSRVSPEVERQRGLQEYMVKIHKEKMNAYFLGRLMYQYPFFIATNYSVSSPKDLAGRSGAASGTTALFFEALGITPVDTEEEYTAMERGLVDIVAMPSVQHSDMSMFELEKYFIDHGFLSGNVVGLLSLDKFNSLPGHLQELLIQTTLDIEPMIGEMNRQWTEDGRKAARDAGLEIVTFSAEEAEAFVELAFEVGWNEAANIVPADSLAKMKAFFAK